MTRIRWMVPLLMLFVWSTSSHVFAQRDEAAVYGVDALSARQYDGGTITSERVMARNTSFTRHLVRWNSEGLQQYGFLNVPDGRGPFPVVMVLHGYVNPTDYRVLTYTTRYADALARAGYVVFHPNYRGHAPSQGRADQQTYRADYAIDVLNLMASLRAQAGKPGLLQVANASRMGLWGHSMGGGIAIRLMTVRPDWAQAVVLYGPMSGDERKNARQIFEVFTNRTRGARELGLSADVMFRLSPINYLSRVTAAVSVHHGTLDAQVPYNWSVELCQKLKTLGKRTECFAYARAPHLFRSGSSTDATFNARVVSFFNRELK